MGRLAARPDAGGVDGPPGRLSALSQGRDRGPTTRGSDTLGPGAARPPTPGDDG